MNLKTFILNLLNFLAFILALAAAGEDYYEILGVERSADNRAIRKAFKKLALLHHPDKSKEDDAQEKFLKINKAYETLKDEDKRKRYDQFGEEDEDGGDSGNQHDGRGFQSWSYYNDDFGLYDDDPEIVTLDYHDFRRSVMESYDFWFINFYSPQCGHCHEMAPTWRRLGVLLDGVVRIGAVNCQDDFALCRQQNIHAYPSLMFYNPEKSEGLKFRGAKDEDELVRFVADSMPDTTVRLTDDNIDTITVSGRVDKSLSWVVAYCEGDADGVALHCPEIHLRKLLAHNVRHTVNFAQVDCDKEKKLCVDENGEDIRGVYFFKDHKKMMKNYYEKKFESNEFRELADDIVKSLDEVRVLDEEVYSSIRLKLEDNAGSEYLIHFVFDAKSEITLEERKLQYLIPRKAKYGVVDCTEQSESCKELHLNTPRFVYFKKGGGYEIFYGKRQFASDVAEFARLASYARTMTTLTPDMVPGLISESSSVFIDFFAPWCPPCLKLLPEFRKASIKVGGDIVFGTVDCKAHPQICNQFGIRAYPTTIFFNQTRMFQYHGEHSAQQLSEFVQEVLRPSVPALTYHEFFSKVVGRPKDQLVLVDFFAPWCGPCMQLAPEWNKLAKMLKKMPEVKIYKVDCTVEQRLCQENYIRGYPAIRMYPMGSTKGNEYVVYTGWERHAQALKTWTMSHLPEITENLTPYLFKQEVVGGSTPFIVDYYTPWCGPCQHFAHIFDDIALSVREFGVRSAKINCERFQNLCRNQNIKAYPTVKFYPGGTEDGNHLESRQPDAIISFVEKMVKNSKSSNKKSRHDEL